MELISRVQGIILKPKEEWVKIKEEPTTIGQLFTSYAVILAAIPAVAQFIGWAFIGFRIPYHGGSWGGRAVFYSIFSYLFSLGIVYLFGLIINALAPNFASTPNLTNSMKLAVYGMTPAWVAGIFYIIPFLGILAILGSLYGIYVLYLGFSTPLLETPKEKVISYLVISIIVIVVLMVVSAVILGALFAFRGVMGMF